jgi:hypothetical protein
MSSEVTPHAQNCSKEYAMGDVNWLPIVEPMVVESYL